MFSSRAWADALNPFSPQKVSINRQPLWSMELLSVGNLSRTRGSVLGSKSTFATTAE